MEEIMQMLASFPPEARLEMVEGAFADQKRLNKLQFLLEQNETDGTCLMYFRTDEDNKAVGWTLETSSGEGSVGDVREALDTFYLNIDPENDMFGDAGL